MDKEKVISKLEKEVQRTYSTKTIVFQNGEKVSEEINTHREPNVRISIEMLDKILALLKENEVVVRCKDCKYRDAEITVFAPSESKYESFTFASCPCKVFNLGDDFFCGKGERKDGEQNAKT